MYFNRKNKVLPSCIYYFEEHEITVGVSKNTLLTPDDTKPKIHIVSVSKKVRYYRYIYPHFDIILLIFLRLNQHRNNYRGYSCGCTSI